MNSPFLIKNVRIYSHDGVKDNSAILIKDGIITEIYTGTFPEDYTILDGNGKILLPGFIDIHVNGGGGGMSIDASVDSIKKISAAHCKFGTTGLYVTTISVEDSILENSVRAIAEVAQMENEGAKILGVHLEGPFLSEGKKGAHQKQYLKKPDVVLFKKLNTAANGYIKILSFAPELEGADELISYLKNQNIVAGLAHSEANYEITISAINKGLTFCTHIFNGMIPFTHKETGPVGAFLTTKNTFVEVISDGVHVTPSAMEVVFKSKGPDEIIIVTDAVTPAGSDLTTFKILGVDLEVRGNSCYVPGTESLAGSALTMNVAVKIFTDNTSATLEQAIRMASLNPAKLLGIDDRKGSIAIGKDADLILVDDSLEVLMTIVEGKVVYQK